MAITKTTTTTTGGEEVKPKIIEAGENQTQVGKRPILPTEKEDGVVQNTVGQYVEKKTFEKGDSYYNPQGRIVTVQQESEDKVFVGESGTNAQWLPKEMVESWGKVEKGKAPKEEKEKDKNPNDTRYGESVTPSKEEKESAEKGAKAEEKDKEDDASKSGHKKTHDDTSKESHY